MSDHDSQLSKPHRSTLCRRVLIPLVAFHFITGWMPPSYASSEIVVNNDPFTEVDNPIVATFTGIRPMAEVSFFEAAELPNIRFSREFLVNSAMQFDEIVALIQEEGYNPETIELSTLRDIIVSSGYPERHLYHPNQDDIQGVIVEPPYPSRKGYERWDAVALTNMIATGVIDIANVSTIEREGVFIETVGFDQEYAQEISAVQSALRRIEYQKAEDLAEPLLKIKNDVKRYNALEQSILRNMGEITFGHPIVYTAEEIGLQLPQSVEANFNVVWVELSATFRELAAEDLDEMAVNFALPEGVIALELVPLEYGVSIDAHHDMRAPSIDVEIGAVKVTVGEVFQRSVSYSYLRPTITASGLREANFSWTMRDEAVRSGSHKFVAVVGLPKGSGDVLEMAMSAHVRIKRGLFAGGGIGGTEAKTIRISL